MLHRSSSSRRRRASRSAASSPQGRAPRANALAAPATSPARRASVAVTPDSPPTLRSPRRSPRHSLAPDLDISPNNPDENLLNTHSLGIPILDRSPRNSLAPDIPSFNKSPRHSLAPDYNRSPRNSLVPDTARSPRHSLVPDSALSPRNSLAPGLDRSSRNSLVPDAAYGSRLSLNPQDFNRSPRNSIIPDSARSPRNSLIPEGSAWNQHRNSLAPDIGRSPRHSLTPLAGDGSRSPRAGGPGDPGLSPRGSPRGSIGGGEARSPRGSIGGEEGRRSPRGSVSGAGGPRGSLTLTFQDPPASRRASDDNGAAGRGRASPYQGISGAGGAGNWKNTSGSAPNESGSRRASSSVSQVSGDEQRRLCGAGGGSMSGVDNSAHARGLPSALTTYGSVAYQLKDANMEASGTCDFVCRAMRIVNRTVVVTVLLACLSTLPIVMLIMGIQFLRDCPREPHIPLYMVVGGALGGLKIGWLLYSQLAARSPPSTGPRLAALSLTLLLLAWFALGNYWILRIKWPDFQPTLFEPNRWCHKTLYTFSLVHLFVVYSILGIMFIVIVVLAACQLVGCPWLGPTRFK